MDGYIKIPKGEEVEPYSAMTGDEWEGMMNHPQFQRRVNIREVTPWGSSETIRLALKFEVYNFIEYQSGAGYKVPSNFDHYLKNYPHCHRTNRAPNIEEIAGPFYPGEEREADKVIRDLTNAKKEVWITFNRRAIYVCQKNNFLN